jgi:small subunit ribosomal protein S8
MAIQHPMSDMIVRVKNAQMANFKSVKMPASKFKLSVLEVLKEQGYITDFHVSSLDTVKKVIDVELKYYHGEPVINDIKVCSKPGLRVYKKYNEIPVVKGGLGIAIVSTSQGVMTGQQAKKLSLGGEVICFVS